MEDKVAQGSVPERSYGRSLEKMRPVKLTRDVMKNAQGLVPGRVRRYEGALLGHDRGGRAGLEEGPACRLGDG